MIWLSKRKNIAFMLVPALLVYLIYIVLPVFISFYYSFTQYTGIGKAKYVALHNYQILIHDPFFWSSLKNTFIVLGFSICVLLPGSFVLALLLNRGIKGANSLKALNFAPSIVAPILIGLIWVFILDPQIGLINGLLDKVGLGSLMQQWIGGKKLTPYSVGLVFSWQQLGFIATIFLAGMKMIPRDVYDSSSIDGANPRQQLFYITIPMLKETFKINVILIITGVFKVFETVYVLTNGGPNHLSDVLVTYMYNMTFASAEYGYGMSLATVTFLLTMVFSLVYLSFNKKNMEE